MVSARLTRVLCHVFKGVWIVITQINRKLENQINSSNISFFYITRFDRLKVQTRLRCCPSSFCAWWGVSKPPCMKVRTGRTVGRLQRLWTTTLMVVAVPQMDWIPRIEMGFGSTTDANDSRVRCSLVYVAFISVKGHPMWQAAASRKVCRRCVGTTTPNQSTALAGAPHI